MGLRLYFRESSSAWLHLKTLAVFARKRLLFIEMKNTVNIEQNDSLSNDLNESNLRDDRNEISPILTFENGSDLSILNSSYQIPDIPKKYIEPIMLDTSLPYVSISIIF